MFGPLMSLIILKAVATFCQQTAYMWLMITFVFSKCCDKLQTASCTVVSPHHEHH
jgi:hypothetical protein